MAKRIETCFLMIITVVVVIMSFFCLHSPEKCGPGMLTLPIIYMCRTLAKMEQQSRHQYIYPKEGKEYQKTWNKERIRKGLATKDRVRSRLRKGKVLAPLTSVVLHRIHLCLLLSKGCVL